MKASPWRLVKVHYGTYVDARNGDARWQDHVLFAGLPIAVAGICGGFQVKLPAAASAGLLTVAGLLSAFLFGVMLQISDRAMSWADTAPPRGPDTSEHAIFLEEIAANAGYASIVSIAAAVVFVVATVTTKAALIVATALGLGIAVHLGLVLFMVMDRVFALTQNRLNRARGGAATVTKLPMEHSKSA